MTAQEGTRIIDAPLGRIRELLLDAERLPEWNPAFWSVEPPPRDDAATDHAIVVRPGLHGTWCYTRVDDRRIDAVWQVPGLRETGTWLLEPDGASATTVTHAFSQNGTLARLLAGAYRGVAGLRLDRLAAQVGAAPRP